MSEDSKILKEMSIKVHNFIDAQNRRNTKQDEFNLGVAQNINALGSIVFPEKKKEESKIIT